MALEHNEYTIQVPDLLGSILNHFKFYHRLEGMDHLVLIKWGILVVVWLLIAFWYQHQNKIFHEYIHNTRQRTKISDRLSHLAYNRAYEFLGLFFLFILFAIFYDTRINQADSQINANQENMAIVEKRIASLETDLAKKTAEATSAIESGAMNPTFTEEQETAFDQLKAKYEDLFVSYYYLKRCKATTPTEFHLLNAGLVMELTDLNAPAGVRKNILSAAKGAHDEKYGKEPCPDDVIKPMQERVHTYIQQVLTAVPDE